jgi:Flp pilus assembly pilin Flp
LGNPSHDGRNDGLWIIASLMILLLVMTFVGILVVLGYGLWAAIIAVTMIGTVTVQIKTRLLGNADDSTSDTDTPVSGTHDDTDPPVSGTDSSPELPEPPDPGPTGL